jgi:hypothetical protein
MAPTAAASPVGKPVEGAADLEHEVLAGIEEFRNQLAQMKAQPGAPVESADEPAAAAAHA